ncbi:MAG: carbon monoxide dehydrogenase subunit G, partial [Acidobacteria bacterium]|nr:carbon monoxide dehydrogenase subunit G [Acidobacteriota bacterium]
MKIAGDYTFEAPQAMVYEALQDPEVLTAVMPGCEKLDKIGENEYEGALNIKIGPVQGKFMGKVRLENLREPEGYTMHVDGRGAPGFVKAQAEIQLDSTE